MEMHQLRYFVAVADVGSFTRAAERCFVSQPSLSQQIQKLEDELTQQLFERLPHGVKLTEAGWTLYDHASRILSEVNEAQRAVRAVAPGVGEPLTIGIIPTIAPYVITDLLQDFGRQWPRSRLVIHEDVTDALLNCCRSGMIDIGVAALPLSEDRLTLHPFHREELLLTLPATHRLARQKTLRLADLTDEPFVHLTEAHCLGQTISLYFADQMFQPRISARSSQIGTIKQLIMQGHGVGLLPAMACLDDAGAGRVYRSLADAPPMRTLTLFWRQDKDLSRVAEALVTWFDARFANAPVGLTDERRGGLGAVEHTAGTTDDEGCAVTT